MGLTVLIKTALGGRKLGALRRQGPRDPRDKLYTPGHRTGKTLVAAGPSDIVSVAPYVPEVYDQGASGACVMHALPNTMCTVESVQGLPYRPRALRAGYYLGRRKDDLHRQDGGMYTDTAFWLANKYGLPSEGMWPWSLARLNEEVPAHVVLEGHTHAGLQYEYIRGNAIEKHALVREAHKEGLPVYAAGPVGRAFMRHRSGVFDTLESPEGGHAFMLVGSGFDGQVPLHELWNSWGLGWGEQGRTWVGPKFFDSLYDLVVVHGWKRSARQRAQLTGGRA